MLHTVPQPVYIWLSLIFSRNKVTPPILQMTNGNLPSTRCRWEFRLLWAACGCVDLQQDRYPEPAPLATNRPTTSKGLSGKHSAGRQEHAPSFSDLSCDRKSKERRGVHATMLCQGARGLTRQGKRSLISARFSHFLEVIVTIPSLRRFASSTAINKLDVIMPAIEDFPARHIGEFNWKQ